MRFEEFQNEMDWWGDESDGFKSRIETDQAWKVSIEEINERNYNLDIKNPHVEASANHDPQELLSKYVTQQKEIGSLRDQLKSILSEALNRETSA
jgi:type I restriction enzyme M protein